MMLKNNKGSTVIAIIMTIIVIAIIVTTLSYSSINSIRIKRLNDLYTDIRLLNDEVAVYYLKYGELPVNKDECFIIDSKNVDESIKFIFKDGIKFKDGKWSLENQDSLEDSLINPNDWSNGKAVYYELDLKKLDNLSLTNEGEYIINEQSHTIFYYDGIKVDGVEYHSLPINYKNVNYNELKEVTSVTQKKDIYLAMGNNEINIKDFLSFNSSDGEDGEGAPKNITYELEPFNENIEKISQNGTIKSKEKFIDSSKYEVKVTVTVEDYFGNKVTGPIPDLVTVNLTDLKVEDENNNEINEINMVKGNEKFIHFSILGYKPSQLNDNIIKINENKKGVVNAELINDNSVSIKGLDSGITNITLKEKYSGALKTIKINVYDFSLNDVDNKKTISDGETINFNGLSSKIKVEMKNNNLEMDMQDVTLDWNSNNLQVFTIEQIGQDINIVPIGFGEAILQCNINLGNNIIDTKDFIVKVEGVKINSLSNNTIVLNSDQNIEEQLSYESSFSNNEISNILWSSNNESIAQIDENGKLIVKSKGEVVINLVVNLSDGRTYEDSCSILIT